MDTLVARDGIFSYLSRDGKLIRTDCDGHDAELDPAAEVKRIRHSVKVHAVYWRNPQRKADALAVVAAIETAFPKEA